MWQTVSILCARLVNGILSVLFADFIGAPSELRESPQQIHLSYTGTLHSHSTASSQQPPFPNHTATTHVKRKLISELFLITRISPLFKMMFLQLIISQMSFQ